MVQMRRHYCVALSHPLALPLALSRLGPGSCRTAVSDSGRRGWKIIALPHTRLVCVLAWPCSLWTSATHVE